MIITFDKRGNKIDSFALLGDIASNDPSHWTKELSIINTDLTIQLVDSIWSYDLDSDGGRIETSGRLTIKNELHQILESGKFE